MAVRTALALCGVGVRLGARLVLGRRCSLKGNAIAELKFTSCMVCCLVYRIASKPWEISSRSVDHREMIGAIRGASKQARDIFKLKVTRI